MDPASPSCARWTEAVPFIGREAVAAEKGKKLTKRLVQFGSQDPQPLLYHNEPIFMNGRNVGYAHLRPATASRKSARSAWAVSSTRRASTRH